METLKSFKNWSAFHSISPREPAVAGFYYFQCEDRVRCAFYRIKLGNWEPNDVAIIDHRRWKTFVYSSETTSLSENSSSTSSTFPAPPPSTNNARKFKSFYWWRFGRVYATSTALRPPSPHPWRTKSSSFHIQPSRRAEQTYFACAHPARVMMGLSSGEGQKIFHNSLCLHISDVDLCH